MPSRTPSVPRRWRLVAVLWLTLVFSNAYLISPASVLSEIIRGLDLVPTSASVVVSVVFGVQILVSVPFGMWLDRIDHRWAIGAAGLGLLAAGLWGRHAALAGDYPSLVASRVLGGAAAVLVWNGGANVIGRAFPARSQATAIGIFTSGAPAGFALGQVTGPVVANEFGWATVFLAYGLAGLVPLSVFAALTVRSPLTVSGGSAPQVGDFRRVLTNPGMWSVGAMGFAATSMYLVLNSWLPTYLTEVLAYPLVTGGLVVGVLPAVGILARSSSGLVSDRLFGGRRRPVLLASFVVATPLVAAIVLTDSAPVLVLVLAIAGFFVQLGPGIFVVQARETVEANVSATAISFVTSLTALGAFVGPVVAGYLIELTGAYVLAFGFAGAMGLFGLLLAWGMGDGGRRAHAGRECPGD